jgi:hypothetical protein
MIELEEVDEKNNPTSSPSSAPPSKEKKPTFKAFTKNYKRRNTMSTPAVLNPLHEISYKDVNDILRKSYHLDDTNDSLSLDILALYLKGQKIIYTESKTFCEQRLHALMLPAIFISCVCSILNFGLKDHPYGLILLSSMNALNSFLLALISYLKLDAKAESHKIAAHKFQKLESLCEFNSGKTLIFKDSVEIYDFVEKIENQVVEIRESNQFIIPESVLLRYPTIRTTNVFTLVKEIGNQEIVVINHLKTIVQKLHHAIQINEKLRIERDSYADQLATLDQLRLNQENFTEEHMQQVEAFLSQLDACQRDIDTNEALIEDLDGQKNNAFDAVVAHRLKYLKMSDTYKEEILEQNAMKRAECCSLYDWCKT